ncbi:MAG TPA: glycolate oxidase subunit GlcF [Rhodocyclaceae bacterium]|nr:glycolate oxidase subunit GlcF [Rhodocyclaceae bacterium]
METHLADSIRHTASGKEAEAILRKCVHCGFCTATCPTYQLLGDELDGPRGRIYLIKQVLEGTTPTAKTRLHLDRCLTCRACETTCPSGVQYGRLLDIGREIVATKLPRSGVDGLMRGALKALLPRPALFGPAMKLGQAFRPLLPAAIKAKVPAPQISGPWPAATHSRRMLALAGCVQPAMLPGINAATARVLDRLGISLVEAAKAGCCGAVRFHLDDAEGAKDDARRNIDAWWPYVENGCEAIVMTASGCGVHVKDYGHLLHDDARYAGKAGRIAALTRDVSEVMAAESERLAALLGVSPRLTLCVAFHAPCTLQHGQRIRGVVEGLLKAAGFDLAPVADSHLCCGSAGTYSVLQAALSARLRENKLAALGAGQPSVIASANIGCITHLQETSDLPVRHWIELIDERLQRNIDS